MLMRSGWNAEIGTSQPWQGSCTMLLSALGESCSAQASVLEIWRQDRGSPEVQKRARGMAEALAAANGAASAGLYAAGSHPSILSGSEGLRETFRGWRAA